MGDHRVAVFVAVPAAIPVGAFMVEARDGAAVDIAARGMAGQDETGVAVVGADAAGVVPVGGAVGTEAVIGVARGAADGAVLAGAGAVPDG